MLWTNYGTKETNIALKKKNKRTINAPWATFWGVFPDLFAFGIPITITIITMLFSGNFSLLSLGHSLVQSSLPINLYQYSHSLVLWAFVFGMVRIIFKRPRLELLGWLLHILIDIPSHSINFYPTPFLFPISNYHFTHGIAWSNQWFMIINYFLLILVYVYFYGFRKKKQKQKNFDNISS